MDMPTTEEPAGDRTQVEVNDKDESGGSAKVSSPGSSTNAVAPAFNEQTNYVSTRKIITVGSGFSLSKMDKWHLNHVYRSSWLVRASTS